MAQKEQSNLGQLGNMVEKVFISSTLLAAYDAIEEVRTIEPLMLSLMKILAAAVRQFQDP